MFSTEKLTSHMKLEIKNLGNPKLEETKKYCTISFDFLNKTKTRCSFISLFHLVTVIFISAGFT